MIAALAVAACVPLGTLCVAPEWAAATQQDASPYRPLAPATDPAAATRLAARIADFQTDLRFGELRGRVRQACEGTACVVFRVKPDPSPEHPYRVDVMWGSQPVSYVRDASFELPNHVAIIADTLAARTSATNAIALHSGAGDVPLTRVLGRTGRNIDCFTIGSLCVAPAYLNATRETVGLALWPLQQADAETTARLGAMITSGESDLIAPIDHPVARPACVPEGCVAYDVHAGSDGDLYARWDSKLRRPSVHEPVWTGLSVSIIAASPASRSAAIRATWVVTDQPGVLIPLSSLLPPKEHP